MSHTRRDEERLAYHDPENGWWFSSGGDDSDEELGAVYLPCLLHDDPDLVELANLPLNWIERRDDDDVTWTREPRPEDWGRGSHRSESIVASAESSDVVAASN